MQAAFTFEQPQPSLLAMTSARNWIAVACADHVRLGRSMGFMQVCHGKAGPLRRIRPGDCVAYYSPSERFGERRPLRAFTAIGRVLERDPYEVSMSADFHPFRRDVRWIPARETPIAPLLARLAFSSGRKNWGAQLRFGLLQISENDMQLIRAAMGAA
ncbi:MAG TPA: EVE domain-containing protein [Telluria sp.]|jgi:hypothetical protein